MRNLTIILLSRCCVCATGPNLNGLFGRTSGTTAGYTYSKANKDKAVEWGEEHLYEYLLNPKKVCRSTFAILSYLVSFPCSLQSVLLPCI